jgi:hypothetical protein
MKSVIKCYLCEGYYKFENNDFTLLTDPFDTIIAKEENNLYYSDGNDTFKIG